MSTRDLEIDDDPAWSDRVFVYQRIGWFITTLLVIAGAAGFFGQSNFTREKLNQANSTLEVFRFGRMNVETHMELEVKNPGREVGVWIAQKFLDKIEIENGIPAPIRSEPTSDGVVYFFPVNDGAKSAKLILNMRATDWGWLKGEVRVQGLPTKDEFKFEQLIYF